MKKIAVLYILLLTSCWCLFTLTRDIGEESVISHGQTHHAPWKTLSYSTPVEMSVFTDIDSIPWEIKDQLTLNWFYENFNNLELSFGCYDWIGFDASGIIWDCAVASTFAPLKKQGKKRLAFIRKS